MFYVIKNGYVIIVPMSKILEVKNLNVVLGGVKVLDNVSFDVDEGDVIAIIGPNGAGKTVLYKTLLGLLPYAGEIKWQPGLRIGYVPQRFDIETDIPMTVEEFLKLRGGKEITEKRINEALDYVQLPKEILKSGLGEISVGQRQRILVSWAILGIPNVLLFDEPTADIDIRGQESIYHALHRLHAKLGLTILLISHDLNVVYRHAKEVLCLNRRKLCFGSPKEILDPKHIMELYGEERHFYLHHDHETHPEKNHEHQ